MVKLHSIVNKVGYPGASWRDYSALACDAATSAATCGGPRSSSRPHARARSASRSTASEWGMTPPTVNAYYNPQMNDINFPAGVLQPPLYDAKMDDAPNYGNTGGTIGHELTHGFDDEGRQFDAQGNLKDWWTQGGRGASPSAAVRAGRSTRATSVVDDIKINEPADPG
jgi:putative endopeptidase